MEWNNAAAIIKNEFIPWAPWHVGPERAKVGLITTGGVYLKKGLHQPFELGEPGFREFPAVVVGEDLELGAADYDQQYARADLNVVFPLERLHELAAAGYLGAVAPFAYSLTGPVSNLNALLSNYAPSVAYRMKRMGVEVALVVATSPVDHQTAGLVARTVELAGVPTIVLGTNREVLERVKAPRAVLVKHPAGAPLGLPGNAGKHQHLLREVFDAAWQFEGPGLITELNYSWGGR